MKTRMIKFTTTAVLTLLLASCSPSSSNQSSQSFQATGSDSNSNSIVGGVNSTAEFQKANGVIGFLVVSEKDGNEMMATCTASLIAPNIAVTAAHCTVLEPGANLIAALVMFDTDFSKIEKEIQQNNLSHVRPVNRLKRHELYLKGQDTNNDIALIGFDGTLPEGFQLAQLPDPQLARTLRAGDALTLAGFGVNQFKIDPRTGSPSSSGSGLLRQIDGIRILSLTATGEEITVDQSQGRGACHGDSGGPAYLKDSVTGKNILVGVTSRSTSPTGSCDHDAIYTGLMGYAKWIQDGLKELTNPAPAPDVKPADSETPGAGSGQKIVSQ